MGSTWVRLVLGAALAVAVLGLQAGPAAAHLPTASADWHWQNPSPHGDLISGLWAQSKDDLLAVGMTRGFLRSADGGATWTAQRVGPPMGFNAVAFTDADHGIAVGETSDAWDFTSRGLMWRTGDGGTTWTNVHLGTSGSAPLGDVAFTDAANGWATGRYGTILRTTDGGDSWAPQTVPDAVAGYDMLQVTMTSATDGWVIGDFNGGGTCVLRTTDGGTTWTVVFNDGEALWAIEGIDAQTAWMGGDDLTLMVTRDGGATWSAADTPEAAGFEGISALASFDATTGIAVTAQGDAGGRILRTADGGATWTVVAEHVGDMLGAVHVRGETAWVAGDDGVLAVTHDAGATWTELSKGVRVPFGNASFVSSTRGWVCGYGGAVLRTVDGGATWAKLRTGTSKNLGDVDFVTAKVGWIVGADGLIRRTADGGAHWTAQRSRMSGGLISVDFVDKLHGWAAGQAGAVLRTKDGGKKWTRLRTHVGWNLAAVQFVSARVGWVVGDQGVLRTTDGGAHWRVSRPSILKWGPSQLFGLSFVSSKVGWVCGVSPAGVDRLGIVYRTDDGGKTWTQQGPRPTGSVPEQIVFGVSFADRYHGVAVGEHSLYLRTDDGGKTWEEPARPVPDESLFAVELVDATTGWAVGSGGTIIKYAPAR